MKKRYILAAALVAAIACVASLGAAVTAHADERLPKFKAGFMMDAATGTAVFEHNADERLPIASMVKIMTLLLCFEELDNGGTHGGRGNHRESERRVHGRARRRFSTQTARIRRKNC